MFFKMPRPRLGSRTTTACLCFAACLAAPAAAQAADPVSTMGTYRGASNIAGIQEWEAWRGAPAQQALDFLADEDWSKIATPYWWVGNWSTSQYKDRMVYSIPMLPKTESSLAEGATGAYDHHFRSLAQMLVDNGQGRSTIRIGWEFNGNWYRWRVDTGGTANYAAYYRRIVTAMRAVPGADFKFDWTTNNGSVPATVNPEEAYPGDAYVDFISQDVYDQSWPAAADAAERWNSILQRPYGLNWVAAFAAAHGKPIGIPEWGIGYWNSPNGGGDSPYFFEKMHEWISQHDVAYTNYWEYEGARLMTENPMSAATFERLFRPSSPNPTPTPTPTPTPVPTATPTPPPTPTPAPTATPTPAPTATPTPAPTATPTPAPTPPPTASSDLAAGRPATASTIEDAGFEAGRATDGSSTTRWSSTTWASSTMPQWWRVDLGARKSVGKVVLDWQSAYAPAYRIQTSNDDRTWTTRASVSISEPKSVTTSFAAVQARYVRVLALRRVWNNVSFWRAAVYGPTAASAASTTTASARSITSRRAHEGRRTNGRRVSAGRARIRARSLARAPRGTRPVHGPRREGR